MGDDSLYLKKPNNDKSVEYGPLEANGLQTYCIFIKKKSSMEK